MYDNILELNGISVEILEQLSYESHLGISIKKNLHYFDKDYLYKKDYPNEVGRNLRYMYEVGKIRNEKEFGEALKNVLSGCKK